MKWIILHLHAKWNAPSQPPPRQRVPGLQLSSHLRQRIDVAGGESIVVPRIDEMQRQKYLNVWRPGTSDLAETQNLR